MTQKASESSSGNSSLSFWTVSIFANRLLDQAQIAAVGNRKQAREMIEERQRIWLEILKELAPYMANRPSVLVLDAISAMASAWLLHELNNRSWEKKTAGFSPPGRNKGGETE